MVNRYCIEALDRTLKDIMKCYDQKYENHSFGGKVIIFGGDFRQILPVVIKGFRGDIIDVCPNKSLLWNHIEMACVFSIRPFFGFV